MNEVEKILKGNLDLIPSPLPLVKIQIMDGKVSLRCKAKSLWTSSGNVLPYYLKYTFPPIIRFFTEE